MVVTTTLTIATGTKTQIGVVSFVLSHDYTRSQWVHFQRLVEDLLTVANESGRNTVATTDKRRELCESLNCTCAMIVDIRACSLARRACCNAM